jgi:hypothetical protein
MKMNRSRLRTEWVLVALLALATPACSTFQYRQVQSDFEEAVLAENAQLNPVIDRSEELYREVAGTLTAERIAELDPKLRANAWMVRSFSEWRSGQLTKARDSAKAGLEAKPVANSRDDVLLHLIPALVIDSEVMDAWVNSGRQTDPVEYETSQEGDFGTAIEKVDEAKGRIGPATPPSTAYYVEYQRWRLLQNWREVIKNIPDARRAERIAAWSRAKVDGKTLDQAAKESRDAIPNAHFLRQQIVAHGG